MKRLSKSTLLVPASLGSSGARSLSADVLGLGATAPGEQGWALLGLILALMVLGILLVSVVPSVRFAVQRDKEAEMIYRGEQMAEAIGRYYNDGRPGWPQLSRPPRYGFLLELKKLRDGVMLGTREIKFARASALIDPMTSEEWEPVRFRDPRLLPYLQAFSGFTGTTIPQEVANIAGPPPPLIRVPAFGTPLGAGQGNANRPPVPGQPVTPVPGPGVSPRPGVPPESTDPDDEPDDDSDDDADDAPVDPLAHIFKDPSGEEKAKSNLPIVGVAPRLKGSAVRSLYGLTNYEDWVFIFIPNPQTMPGFVPNRGNLDQGNRSRISN